MTVLLGPLDAFERFGGAFWLLAWALELLVDVQVAFNVVQNGSKVLLEGSERRFGVEFWSVFLLFSRSLVCSSQKCFRTHLLQRFIHYGLAQD